MLCIGYGKKKVFFCIFVFQNKWLLCLFIINLKGRYPPQTYTDMWLTMLSMVTGAMCYAVTIGHVSALVQSFDTSRRMYNDKVKTI